MFTVGCNWRLNQLFSVAWDGRCRTTGTERNWIGVDLLRMGNWLLGAHRCARFLLLSGPSNSNPFCGCVAAALGAECVDAEASQHVESTASMLGWTRQSSAAAPFTVWPTFLQHGCCGPYGCGDGRSQRLLRVQLSGIFPGQLPPRASQPSSSSRVNSARRRKVHDSRKGSNSVPSRPATPRPFANLGSLLPSQVARPSSPPPPTGAARRPTTMGPPLSPLPSPPPSSRLAEASQPRYVYALRVHMCHACACILPLTSPY